MWGDFAYHRLEFGKRRAHKLQAMETRLWKPPCWARSREKGLGLETKKGSSVLERCTKQAFSTVGASISSLSLLRVKVVPAGKTPVVGSSRAVIEACRGGGESSGGLGLGLNLLPNERPRASGRDQCYSSSSKFFTSRGCCACDRACDCVCASFVFFDFVH